ncbi:MAG: hypothetical protein KBB39_17455 [Phycicoccus sp.]|nr:hypothetical protein [Phycicoccus sp.]
MTTPAGWQDARPELAADHPRPTMIAALCEATIAHADPDDIADLIAMQEALRAQYDLIVCIRCDRTAPGVDSTWESEVCQECRDDDGYAEERAREARYYAYDDDPYDYWGASA